MRLGQIRFENKLTAALFEDEMARPIPGYSTVELIRKAATESMTLGDLAEQMASRHCVEAAPMIPIHPMEVWACDSTFERREPAEAADGARPDVFFKGTARVCVGPKQPIGIRFDSKYTAPAPEIAVILGRQGQVLGYTLANDVSARDIERENPLYLAQSKIYTGSCALGPLIAPATEIADLDHVELTCTIKRGDRVLYTATVALPKLRARIDSLLEYLLRANPVPAGSVLLTGSAFTVPESAALAAGDTVLISTPLIGELENPAVVVQ